MDAFELDFLRTLCVVDPECHLIPLILLSSNYIPPTKRQMQNPVDELGKLDPNGPRRLGNEALRGHPGQGVHLEEVVISFRRQPEVHPRVSPASKRAVRGARRAGDGGGESLRSRGRDEILTGPLGVLVLVVVEARLRADLNQRSSTPSSIDAVSSRPSMYSSIMYEPRTTTPRGLRRRAPPACGQASRRRSNLRSLVSPPRGATVSS